MAFRAPSLLHKSILSYLVLFLLFLGFGLSGFIRSNQLLEKETMDYSLTLLSQKQQEIDARLEEINKLTDSVSLNSRITSFVYSSPDMGKDYYYRMYQALGEVTAASLTHAFVHDIYIYHRRGDEILSSSGVYDLHNFYQQQSRYADLDFEGWYQLISNAPRFHTTYPAQRIHTGSGGEKTILTSLSPLPNFTFGQENNATLAVMIDGDKILEILQSSQATEQSATYILNAQGDIMLAGGTLEWADAGLTLPEGTAYSNDEINGTPVVVASAPSRINDWVYISVSPASLLLQQVDRTRAFSVYFIGGSVVLGLLLVAALAFMNYRPIQKTLRTLETTLPDRKAREPHANEMDYIERMVQHALAENQNMRDNYQEYLPVLQADTLRQLLHGEVASAGEASAALSEVGLSFDKDGFLVLYFAVESNTDGAFGNDWNLIRFVIKNVVEEALGNLGACHVLNLGMQVPCAVVNLPADAYADTEPLRPLLQELQTTLCTRCALTLTFGVSEVQRGAESLRTALIQAQQAQEYCLYHTASSFHFFHEINTGVSFYPFSIEMEQQLLNNVKMGNTEAVDRLLEEIYSTYPAESTSLEVSRCMFFDLMGTALKLLSSMDIDYKQVFGEQDPFSLLYACKTVSAMRRTTHMLFTCLCDHLNAGRSRHRDRLCDGIIEYIDRHYEDPNLSLTTVAEVFGLSPSYLSHFLKQNANENFVSLLRARRVQQVETLLAETSMTIEEIARATGYASSIVLTRNFKKVHGIAPGQYRDAYGAEA